MVERGTIAAGLAERLSVYLQVLTQAKKMGRKRIRRRMDDDVRVGEVQGKPHMCQPIC